MGRHSVLWGVLTALVLTNILVWVYVALPQGGTLTVSFLDVGQGDAVLIESPAGRQVLIDGGKDKAVLRELPKLLGPLDRTIDVVIETHPDADHIGGLPGVFDRYQVAAFVSPNIANDTSFAAALVHAAQTEKGVERITAVRGTRIHLGGGAYADILYPDRAVPGIETNAGSVVVRLVYGSTAFMLSGDAPAAVESWLVALDTLDGDAYVLASDVLKAGHHGSRTSTGATWLAHVAPGTVVISAGKLNPYGHPHAEVVSRIEAHGAQMVSTADVGTVTFVSDGVHVRRR